MPGVPDGETARFFAELFAEYGAMATKNGGPYRGLMLDAVGGYLAVVFDFMAGCYETPDRKSRRIFRCLLKSMAGVAGTFFAYSFLTSGEDRLAHAGFYQRIGAGV